MLQASVSGEFSIVDSFGIIKLGYTAEGADSLLSSLPGTRVHSKPITGQRRTDRVAARAAAVFSSSTPQEQMQQKRVVITGMGVVSPLGHDPDTLYEALLEGKSGIGLIESFDTGGLAVK